MGTIRVTVILPRTSVAGGDVSKRSTVNQDFLCCDPVVPDGAPDFSDRASMAGLYAGYVAEAPPTTVPKFMPEQLGFSPWSF